MEGKTSLSEPEDNYQSEDSSVIYDSDEETAADYKPGGYHPVQLGEIFLNRYIVVQKLGWGHFSTVWLCKDTKFNTYVAMKVQKSARHYTEAAYDEIDILMKIATSYKDRIWEESLLGYFGDSTEAEQVKTSGGTRDFCFVVQLLNTFAHHGPHGKHVCMIFEVLGINLLGIIKAYNYKGIPIPICRAMALQMLMGLDYLHRVCGIIHTDLKPENVLVKLTQEQINEIISKGMLKDRGAAIPVTPQKSIAQTPITELNKEVQPNAEDAAELKRQKAREKKKRYRDRKKQQEKEAVAQAAEAGEDPTPTTTKKKRKRRNRKKNKPAEVKEEEPAPAEPFQDEQPEALEDDEEEEGEVNIAEDLAKEEDLSEGEIPEQQMQFPFRPETAETEAETQILAEDSASEGEVKPEDVPPQAAQKKSPGKEPKAQGSKFNALPPIDENIKVKIVDLGNGCWIDNHFSTEIQTRQYRSPEVIIGKSYMPNADVWSFACMLFELVTGDFLFEPRSGANFDKDDDHLAQMIELLGNFPKEFSLSTKAAKRYFDKEGKLRRIQGFHYWPIKSVLMEKYRILESEAQAFEDFLRPMLVYDPEKRASAQECLSHPWLTRPSNYNYRMDNEEYEQLIAAQSKRLEDIQNRMSRNSSGTPEKIRIPEPVDADIEDNLSASEGDDATDVEPSDMGFDENLSYHDAMNKVRVELLGKQANYNKEASC